MCDPLTIGSALLSVAGTKMQMDAQRRAQRGMESAINTTGEMNDRLREASRGKIMESTQDFSKEKFDQTQADETNKINQKFQDNLSRGTLPGEYYGGNVSENTRVYADKKNAQANDFSRQMAAALANLRGFDQGQTVNNIGIKRASEVVGMNQNKEAGNNAVLPLQIEAAKRKGETPLGDIMVGIGSAGLTSGLSKGAGAGSDFLGSQGQVSRLISSGNPNMVGPVQGFGGFNLI